MSLSMAAAESQCAVSTAIHIRLIDMVEGRGCYCSWYGRLRDVILSLDGGNTIFSF